MRKRPFHRNGRGAEDLLGILRELVVAVNSVRELPETLRLCLDAAVRASGLECGGIYLMDNSGGLRLTQVTGLSEDFVEVAGSYPPDAPHTRLVMRGKPVYVLHTDLEVPLTQAERREGLKALAVIPIRDEQRVIGCLNLASRTVDKVSRHSRLSLETIASGVGLLISRARADEAFREREAWFRSMFERSRDAVFITGLDARFVAVNQAAANLTGYSVDELVGMSILDLHDPEDRNAFKAYFHRIMAGGAVTHEAMMRRKDGTKVHTEFSNRLVEIHGVGHMHTVARDISRRKALEKELQRTVELLEGVYESLDEAVFVVDPRTRTIISCNSAAEKMFGYRKEEMVGRNTEFLHVNRSMYREFGKRLFPGLDAERMFRTEYSGRKKDGTVFPTDHTVKEISDGSGQRTIIVSVVRDISERKKATNELEAQRNELRAKTARLEELNAALKVLLEQRDQEKKSLEESFSENVNSLIIPYLHKIRRTGLTDLQGEYVDVLEANLREIIKPYLHWISRKLMNLSPSELRIVNYLKQGYSTKEIASILKISARTVEFHRDNIRKKLGIKGQKVNLATYLSSIS